MTDLTDALRHGSMPAGELTARLGVSPATLMRRVRAAGGAIVRIGASHATRYGLRPKLPGLGASEVPLFRIDARRRQALGVRGDHVREAANPGDTFDPDADQPKDYVHAS